MKVIIMTKFEAVDDIQKALLKLMMRLTDAEEWFTRWLNTTSRKNKY